MAKKAKAEAVEEPKVEGAVIPGAVQATDCNGMDDIDALLLGGSVSTVKVEEVADDSKAPTITAPAQQIYDFLAGAKAEKDGKNKKERNGALLLQAAAPERIEICRKRNEFLTSVKLVADGKVKVQKIIDGEPKEIDEEVKGAVMVVVTSRYSPVKPDEKRDAKALLSKYQAILGPDYKKLICANRTFGAKEELFDPKNAELFKKALVALQSAGVAHMFEVGYEFGVTDEFHRGATMQPDLAAKMQVLEKEKLVKPVKPTVRAC